MPAPTLNLLITQDLGYCCEWAFFCCHKRTAMIADRLGVTTRAVRRHKAAFYEGELTCENCAKCMKDMLGKAGKIPRPQRNPP